MEREVMEPYTLPSSSESREWPPSVPAYGDTWPDRKPMEAREARRDRLAAAAAPAEATEPRLLSPPAGPRAAMWFMSLLKCDTSSR